MRITSLLLRAFLPLVLSTTAFADHKHPSRPHWAKHKYAVHKAEHRQHQAHYEPAHYVQRHQQNYQAYSNYKVYRAVKHNSAHRKHRYEHKGDHHGEQHRAYHLFAAAIVLNEVLHHGHH